MHFPEIILVIYSKLCTPARKKWFCHREVTPMSAGYMRSAALSYLIVQRYLSHSVSDTLPSTVFTCLNRVSHPQELHSQVNFFIPVWRPLGVSSDILAKVDKLMTNAKAYSICHQINCGTWQYCFQRRREISSKTFILILSPTFLLVSVPYIYNTDSYTMNTAHWWSNLLWQSYQNAELVSRCLCPIATTG